MYHSVNIIFQSMTCRLGEMSALGRCQNGTGISLIEEISTLEM